MKDYDDEEEDIKILQTTLIRLIIKALLKEKEKKGKEQADMTKKICIYIISNLFVVVILVGIIFMVKPSPQEKVIHHALNNLYHIPDYKSYTTILENIEELSLEEMAEYMLFGYDAYCTQKGLDDIINNRWHLFYREAAYKKQFTLELEDIKLVKAFEKKDEQKLGYNYTVILKLNYGNENKAETVTENGYVNMKKVDGHWQIDAFGIKKGDDVFLSYK